MKPEIVRRAINYSYNILEGNPDALVKWIISFKEDVYNIVYHFDQHLEVDWREGMFIVMQNDGSVTYYDMDDIFSITVQQN